MKDEETPSFKIKGLFKEPTPAILEIGDIKKKKSKFQKLVRLMTLEEGIERVSEAVENER